MNVCVIRKRPRVVGLVAAVCSMLLPVAHAESDPLMLTVGETVSHDDNFLRAAAGSEVADWLSETRLRLDFSDAIGRNLATAWASADDSHYRHESQLDNLGYQLGGEFDWNSLYRLSGKVRVDDNSSLYRSGLSGDQTFEGKSILHTQRALTRVTLGSTTPLSIEGGLEVSSSKNSASALAANDVSQWVGDAGVSYAESPNLRLSLFGRRTSGRYPDFVPAAYSFHRNDVVLGGDWVSGGFSSFQAQVAYSQDDYSGSGTQHYWTGFLRGNWQVTGHTTLSASLARDTTQNYAGGVLGQVASGGSQGGTTEPQSDVTQQSLSLNVAANLSVRWQPTSKIDVTGSYLRTSRRYNGVSLGGEALEGSDSSSEYQIGLAYQFSRGVRAGCSGARSTHDPGDLTTLGSAYVSNAYSCFAELSIR